MPIIGSASVQIRAVDKFFERDVRAAVRKIKDVNVELKADIDLTKVNKKIRDLRYRLRNNVIQLNIDAQTETIEADFERIVNHYNGQQITLEANADTAAAEVQLAAAARNRSSRISARIDPATQKALKGLFYTLTGSIPFDKVKASLLGLAGNFEGITIKGAAVVSVVSAISSALFSLAGSAFTIGSDLSDLIGITAALPAGIFMFGTAIAAATLGWKGFSKAVGGDAKVMAQLPKEAQKAAKSLQGVGGAIRKVTQISFWKEMGGAIESLHQNVFPQLKKGLSGAGTAMGKYTREVVKGIWEIGANGSLETMFNNSNVALTNMGRGVAPVITALGKLGSVGSKLLPEFGTWLSDLGVKFGNFIANASDDKITSWIRDAVTSMQLLGSSVGSIASIFSGISAAANEAGFGGLSAFADGLSRAADVANSEPFKSQMVIFFNAASEASDVFNESVYKLFKTLGNAAPVLGGMFSEGVGVVSAFIDNISAMLSQSDILSGLYTGISDFRDALTTMQPGFVHLGNIIGGIAKLAGTVFTAMAPGFNDIMDTLDQVFSNLGPGLNAVVPVFNAFVQAVISIASGPIVVLAGAIGGLLSGFAGMPGPLQLIVMSLGAMVLLGPRLTTMLGGISSRVGTFTQNMSGMTAGLSGSQQNMYRHFNNTRDAAGRVGTALRSIPFAAATSGLGGVATAAGGAFRAMGATAGNGLRGALSGGAAMMGGPWGIAIAGGIALMGLFGAANEESKAKVDGLSKTLDQVTGHATNATKTLLANNALDGVTDEWDDFVRGFLQNGKSTEETLSTLGMSTQKYIDILADSGSRDGYVKGLKDIERAMITGQPVTDEMARAIGSTKEALQGLDSSDIKHLGDKAKDAAEELAKAEEKVKRVAEATGLSSAAATVFSKNLETLGSASTSASDKFSALKSNLDLLNGGMNGIVNTKKGLAQALADSKTGLDEIAAGGTVALNSLYSVKDGFDFTTQAGRNFHTELESSTDAILKNGTAAMDQALKSGKSASEANSIAIQAMQPGVQALRDQLKGLGVEQPKIDAIIRSFGLMPDQIATAVEVNGTEEAQRKIFLTKLAADSFANGNYASVLSALPADAKKAIADATGTADAFADGDYGAVLRALNQAPGGSAAALATILSVTNGNYDAALKALNLTFPGTQAAKEMIASVKDHTISIKANSNVDATVWHVQTQLASLKDKRVNVTTYYDSRSTGEAGSGRQVGDAANGAILRSVTGKASSLSGGQFGMQNIRAFADGGFEKHTAQFAKAGAMRLWAEPETGGEAYIPLAKGKRTQSLKILEEVARIFGFGLHNMQMANGGVEKSVGQAVNPSASLSTGAGTNLSLNVYPSPGLSEIQIAEAAANELYWRLLNK